MGDQLDVRARHARRHLEGLYSGPLVEKKAGDSRSGFFLWLPTSQAVDWDFFSSDGESATAWIHVPSLAGRPGEGEPPAKLGELLVNGTLRLDQFGAPFALATWRTGKLILVNDLVGLVRLFHYRFIGGDVWTTRQGLGHVFMAEEPTINRSAWASMATTGWALNGDTQLGDGCHVPGATKIISRHDEFGRSVHQSNSFGDWLEWAQKEKPPSKESYLRDIEAQMLVSSRWEQMASADLSGGKDSRLIAAVGIRAGLIASLKTINSDAGEVDTAKKLVQLLEKPIEHRISSPDYSVEREGLIHRLRSLHRAFEGRYVAATAVKAPFFEHFRFRSAARFNGLTGPYGADYRKEERWKEFENLSPSRARSRLQHRVLRSFASADAKKLVLNQIDVFMAEVNGLGLQKAGEVMDFFHFRRKMPHWTVPSAQANTIFPLLSTSIFIRSFQMDNSVFADHQRALIRIANPAWARVPFYSPSLSTRTKPWIWNLPYWSKTADFVLGAVESQTNFEPAEVATIVRNIRNQEDAGQSEERLLERLVFQLTFDHYVDVVRQAARACKFALKLRNARHFG